MKKVQVLRMFLASLFCVLISLSCMVSTLAASAKDNSEALTVGVPSNRPPIFYRDPETNNIAGIGVDLMRSAAAKAGYHVTFQFVKEKTLKDALDDTTYDVVMPFGSAVPAASGHPSVVSLNLREVINGEFYSN